jgi:phenylpropionate dioxygenase-like ring-hydroxylating dioxygenase large terminal subunit
MNRSDGLTMSDERLDTLVGEGRVHRRFYTDPAVFEAELDRIFGRAWLWLGHESQLKQPGDYFTTRMGRDRIIVARHSDGTIHAFHNRCTHRGAEVCPKRRGHTKTFECPYHAWTFRTDGSLESVPLRKGYEAEFDKRAGSLGLEKVPRVASYRGFVFGSKSATGDDLETFLGPDVRAAFDNLVDRAPDGTVEMAGGVTVQRYRANWKLQIENSIDLLHPRILHRSAIDAADLVDHKGREPSIEWDTVKANGLTFKEWDQLQVAALPRGHCWMGGFLTKSIDEDAEKQAADAVVQEGGWRALQARYRAILVERYGTERTDEILSFNRHNTIVYPNLFVNSRLAQIRILHPTAVDSTEQHGYIFRLGGAPKEMFEASVRMVNTNNSPSSIVTSDDHEIFERIQEALATGDGDWEDWTRGLHQETEIPGGRGGEGTNEVAMRNQHRAWAEYMGAA